MFQGHSGVTSLVMTCSAMESKRQSQTGNCSGRLSQNSKMKGVSFPAAVTEGVKTIKKKTSKIMEAVQELKGDDNPDIDDGDIAAVLMAADELKLLKIFPPTPENIYKAFVKTTDAYINDETISKMAVDYYLKKIGEQG